MEVTSGCEIQDVVMSLLLLCCGWDFISHIELFDLSPPYFQSLLMKELTFLSCSLTFFFLLIYVRKEHFYANKTNIQYLYKQKVTENFLHLNELQGLFIWSWNSLLMSRWAHFEDVPSCCWRWNGKLTVAYTAYIQLYLQAPHFCRKVFPNGAF